MHSSLFYLAFPPSSSFLITQKKISFLYEAWLNSPVDRKGVVLHYFSVIRSLAHFYYMQVAQLGAMISLKVPLDDWLDARKEEQDGILEQSFYTPISWMIMILNSFVLLQFNGLKEQKCLKFPKCENLLFTKLFATILVYEASIKNIEELKGWGYML